MKKVEELKKIIKDLIERKNEEEWFEFKENWYNPQQLGTYISAISNVAAVFGKKEGYFVWGINDTTHDIVGTNFDYNVSYKSVPLKNYLASKLNPSIAFQFYEIKINNKRVVILVIPKANKVPTSFEKIRYYRIGSSKINLENHPEREGELWQALNNGYPTMVNTISPIQNLTFVQLKQYYLSKNIAFNDSNYQTNLHLLNEDNKYNMLGCYLADNGEIPVRVAIFSGGTKSSKLFSVKEFGYESLISVIDRIIAYANTINIPKAEFNFENGTRNDTYMFDQDSFNEAVKNAFIHNSWLRRVAPLITFYDNRVEIISFSGLAPNQTIEGFFLGNSIPVNEDLSNIYLATHTSERSGRGVPTIVNKYGKEAFEINEHSIKVTIPYNWIKNYEIGTNYNNELLNEKLSLELGDSEKKVLNLIIANPKITQPELCVHTSLKKTRIQKIISCLKEKNLILRIGSNKNGYWKVNLK